MHRIIYFRIYCIHYNALTHTQKVIKINWLNRRIHKTTHILMVWKKSHWPFTCTTFHNNKHPNKTDMLEQRQFSHNLKCLLFMFASLTSSCIVWVASHKIWPSCAVIIQAKTNVIHSYMKSLCIQLVLFCFVPFSLKTIQKHSEHFVHCFIYWLQIEKCH